LTKIKAVIFDLDGVIADSKETIYEVFQRLFDDFGFRVPSKKEIARFEAHGRARIIEELLPPGKREDAGLRRRMDERCAVIAGEVLVKIRPMGGAEDALRLLKKNKVKVALATNRGSTAPKLLGLLGLAGYFDAVVNAKQVKKLKPHPEPLLLALKRLGVGQEEAVFVGDSGVDLAAGRAAGIKTVLLTKREAGSGVRRIRSLAELGPLLGIGK